MKKLMIKSKQDIVQIYEEILDSLNQHNLDFISVELKDNSVVCSTLNREEFCIDFLSKKLSVHIVENIQPRMIRDEVLIEFENYIDDSVEEFIKKITWKLLYKDEQITRDHIESIRSQIELCMTEDKIFNLDGFVRFRLNGRKKEIQEYIYDELDQILDEEEFENFTNILRQYVSIKLPENDLIHFIMIGDRDFEFVTGDRQRIDLTEIDEVCDELEMSTDYKIETKDFILGIIMTLSPKRLIIHTNYKQDPNIVYILNKIYGARSSECHGCEFCEKIRTTRIINKDKN